MSDNERRRRNRRRRKDFEERLESARKLVRFALSAELHPDARRRVLNEALWIATESEYPKHKLSFRTPHADAEILRKDADTELGARVRHEHVMPRKWLRERIIQNPDDAEAVLASAVGCVVTVAEAEILDRIKDAVGWDRYKQAGLTVIEVQPDGSIKPFTYP